MFMNPQNRVGQRYGDMFGGHNPSQLYSPHHPIATANSVSSFHDDMTGEFYSSSPAATSGSCYNPSTSEHGSLIDTNSHPVRTLPPSYGYAQYNIHTNTAAVTDQSMSMYQQSLWHNSHHIMDDKRGSVIMGQAPTVPTAKRKGGRKPKDDPNLPPIEKEKRRLRRLRNKDAAAKCRERRLNHTSSLLQQIEQLEKSQTDYEDKIAQLRQHKDQCENLLTSHIQECNKTFSIKSAHQSSRESSPAASINTPSPPTQSQQLMPSKSTNNESDTVMVPPASTPRKATSKPEISTSNNAHSTHSSSLTSSAANSRRKQTTPRGLNLDISCADSHRRSSSSSNGDLQSPKVIM